MSFRQMDVGMVPALVGRVSFTGDLGYEIWVTSEYQRALHDLLVAAGRAHGLRPFGARALNSMRLEKSFGTWAREFRPIYGAYEGGLCCFVDLRKADLPAGRPRWKRTSAAPHCGCSPLARVDAACGCWISGDEPIWQKKMVWTPPTLKGE